MNGNRRSKMKTRLTFGHEHIWCAGPCGKRYPAEMMTIDHIRPTSKGGTNRIDNLQLMCRPCNLEKGNTYCEA